MFYFSVGSTVWILPDFQGKIVHDNKTRNEILHTTTIQSGVTIAHELAHAVLNAEHANYGANQIRCHCEDERCVMFSHYSSEELIVQWSNCSQYLAKQMLSNRNYTENCLKLEPVQEMKTTVLLNSTEQSFKTTNTKLEGLSTTPSSLKCGNGLVDPGEECDCWHSLSFPGGKTHREDPELVGYGVLPRDKWEKIFPDCDPNCCDMKTCKFKLGAECSMGNCCENCKIKQKDEQSCGSTILKGNITELRNCDHSLVTCSGWSAQCGLGCSLHPTKHRTDSYVALPQLTNMFFCEVDMVRKEILGAGLPMGFLPSPPRNGIFYYFTQWKVVEDGPFNGIIFGYEALTKTSIELVTNGYEKGFTFAAFFRPNIANKDPVMLLAIARKDWSKYYSLQYVKNMEDDAFVLHFIENGKSQQWTELPWSWGQWNFIAITLDIAKGMISVNNENRHIVTFYWDINKVQVDERIQVADVGPGDGVACITFYRQPLSKREIGQIPALCRSQALGRLDEKFLEPNRFVGRFLVENQTYEGDDCYEESNHFEPVKHDDPFGGEMGGSYRIHNESQEPSLVWKCPELFVDSGVTVSMFIKLEKTSSSSSKVATSTLFTLVGTRTLEPALSNLSIVFHQSQENGKVQVELNENWRTELEITFPFDLWNFIAVVYRRKHRRFDFYSRSGANIGTIFINPFVAYSSEGPDMVELDMFRQVVEKVNIGPFNRDVLISCVQLHWAALTPLEIAMLQCHCHEGKYCKNEVGGKMVETNRQFLNSSLGHWPLMESEGNGWVVDEIQHGSRPIYLDHSINEINGRRFFVYAKDKRNKLALQTSKQNITEIMAIYQINHDHLVESSLTIQFWLWNTLKWDEQEPKGHVVFLEIRNLIKFSKTPTGIAVQWNEGMTMHSNVKMNKSEPTRVFFSYDHSSTKQILQIDDDNRNWVFNYRKKPSPPLFWTKRSVRQNHWDLILKPMKPMALYDLKIYADVL